ncbi:MAG: tRNA (guanosine(37)-N1)-methyltransferase TrmD [Actinomycetes bacterium]
MPRYDLITIFPDYFSALDISLIGKARSAGLVEISVHDLREQAQGVHKSVDDTPYGGGAGMVMSPEPWGKAIDKLATSDEIHDLIVLTPAGKKFDQNMAIKFSQHEHLIFACGRYEGIDHRVTEFYKSQPNFRVHEVSIGDYVLNGGEVATLVMLEAIIRLIPGVIGNPESLAEESHTLIADGESIVEYPNYTKPAVWRELCVPEVLLSGNHAAIKAYRSEEALKRTKNRE